MEGLLLKPHVSTFYNTKNKTLNINNMKFSIQILFLLLLEVGSLSAKKSKPLFPQTPGMVSYTYRNSFAKDVAATLDTSRVWVLRIWSFRIY